MWRPPAGAAWSSTGAAAAASRTCWLGPIIPETLPKSTGSCAACDPTSSPESRWAPTPCSSGRASKARRQDLHAGALALSKGFNRLYCLHFLKTLKRKSILKLGQFPDIYDRRAVAAARDFFDFDDLVTAPLHGFDSAIDYWTRSSCRQFLGAHAGAECAQRTVPAGVLAGRPVGRLPARPA